jgi:uridine phosphorylase
MLSSTAAARMIDGGTVGARASVDSTDRDPDNEPVVTAAGVLAWRERSGGAGLSPIPVRVLLALDGSIVSEVRRRHSVREATGPAGRFAVVKRRTGEPIGLLVPPGVGGPALAVAVEEAAALGAREVISIGLGGGISAAARPGAILLLDAALPDDGTSAAYGAGPGPVGPDADLTSEVAARLRGAGLEHERATSWTTDAVYRETPVLIRAAAGRGASVVEMEAAGLFAVARALGIRAAAVVVVADDVSDLSWRPPRDLAACRRSLHAVAEAILVP